VKVGVWLAVTVIVAVPFAELEQLVVATFVNVYVKGPGVPVETGSVTEALEAVVVIVCGVAFPVTV
jgi:hypothetical protein